MATPDEDQYKNLKSKISSECNGPTDLEKLKEYFRSDIASKRDMYRIKTPHELIAILEERDCVTKEHVALLAEFGQILNKQKISDLAHTYKKLYCPEVSECSICHVDMSKATESSRLCEVVVEPMGPTHSVQEYSTDAQPISLHTNDVTRSDDDLDNGINILSAKLHKSWPVLARTLDLTEKQINIIRKDYPGEYSLQAEKALSLWKTERQEAASLHVLKTALEDRLCKRAGLGQHLLRERLNPSSLTRIESS